MHSRRIASRNVSLLIPAVLGLLAVVTAALPCRAGEIAIQTGQKLAFVGDSITAAGWESPTGYVKLVISGLEVNGIKVTPLPAGVSGNKSNDMLNRLEGDVLSKKPDWLTLSCGVNDVWHSNGIPLDQFQKNMTSIVDRAQAAGIKVIILTATMIDEDATNANNQKLAGHNAFLRQLARDKHCPLADLSGDMLAQVKQLMDTGRQPAHLLTMDGVHMNPRGNMMMADGILRALGLDDAQITKAHNAWLDMPDGWTVKVTYQVTATKGLTLREFLQLQQQAPKDNAAGIWDQLQASFQKDVESVDGLAKLKQDAQNSFNKDIEQHLKP